LAGLDFMAIALLSILCNKKPGVFMKTPGFLSAYQSCQLTLAYLKHLGSAARANALSCWFAILHLYRLRITHFFLLATLHTIGLHWLPPFIFGEEYNMSSSIVK